MKNQLVRFHAGSLMVLCGQPFRRCAGSVFGQTSYPMITHVLPLAVQRGHASEVEVFGQQDFAGTYKAIFEVRRILWPRSWRPPKKETESRHGCEIREDASFREQRSNVRRARVSPGFRSRNLQPRPDRGRRRAGDRREGAQQHAAKAQRVQLPAAIPGHRSGRRYRLLPFSRQGGRGFDIQKWCAPESKTRSTIFRSMPTHLLSILDSHGKELVSNDDYFFADPYLVFQGPADGDYVVQIRDVKYDGDPRWVYVLLRHRSAPCFPSLPNGWGRPES